RPWPSRSESRVARPWGCTAATRRPASVGLIRKTSADGPAPGATGKKAPIKATSPRLRSMSVAWARSWPKPSAALSSARTSRQATDIEAGHRWDEPVPSGARPGAGRSVGKHGGLSAVTAPGPGPETGSTGRRRDGLGQVVELQPTEDRPEHRVREDPLADEGGA